MTPFSLSPATFSKIPMDPDKRTVSPVLNISVASATPTKHGRPYSRATTAPEKIKKKKIKTV